jgi:hypothetical protein
MRYTSLPGAKTKKRMTNRREYSSMSWRRETNKPGLLIVIIALSDEILNDPKLKKREVHLQISEDWNWFLVTPAIKGLPMYKIQTPTTGRACIHVPINGEGEIVEIINEPSSKKERMSICETKWSEEHKGWEFRIIDAIRFKTQLRAVS